MTFSASAGAAVFGGVGGRPANPDPNIEHSKQWFIYNMKPGETKQDAVIVSNNTDEKATIMVYPADSTSSTDGGFALEQYVESRDFVGSWIKLGKEQVTLEPGAQESVPFTITVPNDPKLDVGEHTGGILIQKVNQKPVEQGGMQLLMRSGVRVYVTIPGDVIKKLEIESLNTALNKEKKIYVASLVVKNSGTTSQDVTLRTKITPVYSWMNYLNKGFPITNKRDFQVLRGNSLVSNFEFPKPLIGKLKVEAWVDYDKKAQTLLATPVIVTVPLDTNVFILIVIAAVFFIALAILISIRKKHGAKKKKKNRK